MQDGEFQSGLLNGITLKTTTGKMQACESLEDNPKCCLSQPPLCGWFEGLQITETAFSFHQVLY